MIKLTLNTFIKVCSICIVFSCKNNYEEGSQLKGDHTSTQKTNLEDESDLKLLNEQTISNLSVEKIDLRSIKKKFVESYTSGVYSKKESEYYLPRDQPAFYWVYYFINPDTDSPIAFIGMAVVACQEHKGWDYFNDQEELVEFSAFSNQLNPFIETVRIGETKKDVIKKLGNDFKQDGNNLFYSDQMGNVANLLITKDTVQAIKVGRYEKPKEVMPIKLKW